MRKCQLKLENIYKKRYQSLLDQYLFIHQKRFIKHSFHVFTQFNYLTESPCSTDVSFINQTLSPPIINRTADIIIICGI